MRFIIRSLRELKIRQEVYRIGLFTLVTAMVWIMFEIYRAWSTPKIPQVLQEQLRPLNPSINLEQLQSLERRLAISDEELVSFVPILPEGQEGRLVVIPATPSGVITTPTPLPQATGSGTVNQ